MISVKLSHGSGSECGGSRFTASNNQQLGGNKALRHLGILQHAETHSHMPHCRFNQAFRGDRKSVCSPEILFMRFAK